jgi:hypothetical protein
LGPEQAATECSGGAASEGRGKVVQVPAVRLQQALDLLDQGDVEGARRALAALVRSSR